MNRPNWMKDNVWRWLTGIILSIIGIIVFSFWSSHPTQAPGIKGDDSIQVINTPGTTIIKKEIDPEAHAIEEAFRKKMTPLLEEKGYKADPQLVSKLKDKIQKLEKELEERTRTTKDKRVEDALVAFKAGNYEKARELFETLREEGKEKEREHADTAHNLGNVYFVELDFPKAIEAYLDAVRLAPDNSTCLNEAGIAFYTLAQYDKAIEYYEKALKSDLKTFGEYHPDVAGDWNNLGGAWKVKGEYAKAIECFEKALKSDLKTFGEYHPDVAGDWNNLGGVWKVKGEYDKAIECFEKVLKSDLKTFVEDHPKVAGDWNNLGGAWNVKGENAKAIECFEKALKSDLKTFGEGHPKVATSWNNLGITWYAMGEYAKAIEYLEKALKSVLKTFGEDHTNVATSWNNLGLVWNVKGEYDKAIEYFEKALSVFRVKLGNDHPNTRLVETNLSFAKKEKLESK